MDFKFFIPTTISIISLIWNYIQNRKILELSKEIDRKNLIHKFQFEKEFNVYSDLWSKLVHLRDATIRLRPEFDFLPKEKSDAETKEERLKIQWEKFLDVLESFECNMPFYSKEIYNEINGLLILANKERIDYHRGDKKDNEYWERAEKNIKTVTASMEKISNLIRKRIEFAEVN